MLRAPTPRESEAINHVLTGKTDKEIANEMGIAVRTVKRYLGRVYLARGYYGSGSRVKLVVAVMMERLSQSELTL